MKKLSAMLMAFLISGSGIISAQTSIPASDIRFLGKTSPLNTLLQDHFKSGVFHGIHEFDHTGRIAGPYNFPSSPALAPTIGFGGMSDEVRGIPLLRNFNGLGNENGSPNPDTQGDVGPDHYLQIVKSSVQIWDKDENSLYGPADIRQIFIEFPGPWHDMMWTDPIVLYDHLSDRWILTSMLYELPDDYYEMIAVSDSPDPLGMWNCYALYFDRMPDYPKFGVWPDGYYLMFNEWDIENDNGDFSSTFIQMTINVFNREELQAGVEDPAVIAFHFEAPNHSTTTDLGTLLPADLDGPPPPENTPNFLITQKDDEWGYDYDMLWLWECSVDWDEPDNSYMQEVSKIPVSPFFSNAEGGGFIRQPNTTTLLHSHTHFPMYRLQYRNFGTHQSMVFNHTIDVDSTSHAGIRWYELRDEGNGWQIHQEGTWCPDADSRWMGSIAMDADGNIALGYSVSSTQTYPSIRVTGRRYYDPPGEMTLPETEIMTGGGNQSYNPRWGDYSMMSVDPVDDLTFWYTQMYLPSNGALVWETMISAFRLDKNLTIYPDTLFYDDYDTALVTGRDLTFKNTSPYPVALEELEESGIFPGASGCMWYIENMPALPFEIQPGDSTVVNVKLDFVTSSDNNTYYYDQIDGQTDYHEFSAVVAVNEQLLTSTENFGERQKVRVSPNPFSGRIAIRADRHAGQILMLEVMDARMNTVRCIRNIHSVEITWDGKNKYGDACTAGIYFLRIFTEEGMLIRKVVKL